MTTSMYTISRLVDNISLRIDQITSNIEQLFLAELNAKYEKKCTENGLVKEGSIEIISYSSGVNIGNKIGFTIVFDCEICDPVEDTIVRCRMLLKSKAGITAVTAKSTAENPSPITMQIARDHFDADPKSIAMMDSMKSGDEFDARIIGTRKILGADTVSVIGVLVV